MRFQSIKNPWARAVALGIKPIENRRQAPPKHLIGQQVGIHAGLSWDGFSGTHEAHMPDGSIIHRTNCVRGGIIAVGTLVGFGYTREGLLALVTPEELVWWAYPQFGIVYRQVVMLETPVPVRGMLGWPRMPADVEAAVRAQI